MIKVVLARYLIQQVKRLRKKFPHILDDLEPVKRQLEDGETPGDRLQGVGTHIVYKVRIKNSDIAKGKSGGYRLVYYIRRADTVVLLSIYSKSDQTDISTELVRRLLQAIAESEDSDDI
jgi:mRNA-degrading endonuclease RelE of RelBE toxin-antitoxin system